MPSKAQEEFFDELLNSREFPQDTDKVQLSEKFSQLSPKAASSWIENAMALPRIDSAKGDNTPPPF